MEAAAERASNLELEGLLRPGTQQEPSGSSFTRCCSRLCSALCCIGVLGGLVGGAWAYKCVQDTMAQDSIVLPLVKDLQGGQWFTLANMSSVPVDKWVTLSNQLMESWTTDRGYSFGYASMDDAPKLLWEASKVDGVFNKVPEKLRGVYWMRHNPIPEVLAVIQYGEWYEEEQTLLLPNTPWTWAWWGGKSSEYPKGLSTLSKAIYTFSSGKSIAESYTEEAGLDTVVSFRFSSCPAGAECIKGSDDLTYAELMSHAGGDLSKHGMVYYDGYTMEEMPAQDVDPAQRQGSLYFRRAELFCGLFGRGSGYELTKILDGDGNPVQPFYNEYQQFMANKPLIIWSGMPDSRLPYGAKTSKKQEEKEEAEKKEEEHAKSDEADQKDL